MRRWPDWMPVPQQDGYTLQAEDRRAGGDFGVFAPFPDEFGIDEGVVECTLLLDQVQCAWFESFEGELLSQGAEWFEMPLLSGREVTWHRVRMRERPSFGELKGCLHTVATLKLELEDVADDTPGPEEIPAWPDDFPLPVQDGYSYAVQDRRAWAQMEAGNLARVEFGTDETAVTCSLVMTRAELERLRKFVRTTLKRGTRWFLMPLQTAGSLDVHTVRLKSLPQAGAFVGLYLRVDMELDVWRRENPMCPWMTELLTCQPPEIWADFHETFEGYLNGIDVRVPDFWLPLACRERRVLYEYEN